MTTRVLTFAALVFSSALGCSTSPTPPSGAVGSHVWLASSTGIDLSNVWFTDSWGPDAGPGQSGTGCLTLERAAMSREQLAALEQLVLIPLTNAGNCPADGFDYTQLTVRDGDGSVATYRDTGCSYLRVEGAMGMLPPRYFATDAFPLQTSGCPQ